MYSAAESTSPRPANPASLSMGALIGIVCATIGVILLLIIIIAIFIAMVAHNKGKLNNSHSL